jgi:hypothetical protein
MNTDVITRLHELCRREHACTVDVIEALLECERTGAHLDRGHDGLWSLLARELGYSNAAASRRLKATRCARKFPEVIAWLRARRVTLSSLEAVEPVLASIATAQDLLDRIEGKAPSDVARAVQREKPVAPKKETVRRKFVKPAPASTGGLFEAASVPACEPVVENVQASLSFTPEEFAVVEKARAILSRKTGRMPTVHETMMELARFFVAAKGPRPARGRASDRKSKSSEQGVGHVRSEVSRAAPRAPLPPHPARDPRRGDAARRRVLHVHGAGRSTVRIDEESPDRPRPSLRARWHARDGEPARVVRRAQSTSGGADVRTSRSATCGAAVTRHRLLADSMQSAPHRIRG